MTRKEMAVQKFSQGSVCSQSVLCAFSEVVGVEETLLHKFATGFGGGFGRKQYTCGAVSGAVAALGLYYGNSGPDNRQAKEKAYTLTRNLLDAFEARMGSSNCKDLLGFSLDDKEALKAAEKEGTFKKVCPRCIENAVEILNKIIANPDS